MANKDAAFGLKPIGKVGQNRDSQGLSEYDIAASATAIYFQDPVGMAATALKVNGSSEFVGLVTAKNVYVSGMLTASAIDLQTGTQGQLVLVLLLLLDSTLVSLLLQEIKSVSAQLNRRVLSIFRDMQHSRHTLKM